MLNISASAFQHFQMNWSVVAYSWKTCNRKKTHIRSRYFIFPWIRRILLSRGKEKIVVGCARKKIWSRRLSTSLLKRIRRRHRQRNGNATLETARTLWTTIQSGHAMMMMNDISSGPESFRNSYRARRAGERETMRPATAGFRYRRYRWYQYIVDRPRRYVATRK